jgi:type I restriction enzyme M protein
MFRTRKSQNLNTEFILYILLMAKTKKDIPEEPLEKKLWKAADKLRKNMDAAEYKHVVLGLIFLKYISDAFEELYNKLKEGKGDYDSADPEDKNEYSAEKVFYVPSVARWTYLQARAKLSTIGKDIDDAMDAIEKDNPSLKGVLPKVFAQEKLDKTNLGGLVDLVSTATLGTKEAQSKDILGRVFEYFLGEFALAEGKKGGQFYTPVSVVKLLVEMLEPYEGRVFDPCCGSGGMFVQSEKFIKYHQDHYKKNNGKKLSLNPVDYISIYGQESNQTTWRLAKMNLSIRGIDSSNVKWNNEGSFLNDAHKDLKADYIIANPPFNDSEWSGELLKKDGRWIYGIPPASNANFAWIQHFIYHLAQSGKAAFVMHCGAASNKGQSESMIRKKIIKEGLIDCIVALPTQLFSNTTLPVHLWFLKRKPKNNDTEVLMIDAYNLGTMMESTLRELSSTDISIIAKTYHDWLQKNGQYSDTPGFCKSVSYDEIDGKSYIIAPNRYIERVKKHRQKPYREDIDKFLSNTIDYASRINEQIVTTKISNGAFKNAFLKNFDKTFNKSSWEKLEVSEVIAGTISGSWGNDEPKKDNIPVKVIRGTDLPNIPLFNLKKTPTRFLNKEKVEEIKLQEGDIVIELSGGSKDQPTGRSAIITHELLLHFGMPLICSNFCRVIRVNEKKVNPYWFFFFWNQCYEEGLTTRYENQPSGIKNFQLDEFISGELITLPPRPLQDEYSQQLKSIFELKNKLAFTAFNLSKMVDKTFENIYYDFDI